MTPRYLATAAFVCLVALPALMPLLSGCESTPDAPVYNNPFDPVGDAGGDPLRPSATLGDSVIVVRWTQPMDMGLTTYEIQHSNTSFSDFIIVGEVPHDQADTTGSFLYRDPEPTQTHYFKVRAFAGDDFSLISDQVPALKVTPPFVYFGDGSGTSPTRFIDLEITVSQGDSLRLADNPDFTGQTVVPVTAVGTPDVVAWDLGASAGNDSVRTIHILSEPANGLRDTAIVDVTIAFAPAFGVVGDPATVPSQTLDLYIPTAGVLQMRFANTLDALALTPWLPVQDTLHNYNITASANPQTIYGQFDGDFGFTNVTTLEVVPDLLTEATFTLDLPEDHISESSTVRGLCNAQALIMRFSESLDFSGVVWQDYSDSVMIQLSPGEGRKVIHGQFRNAWADSPILTDYVIHVSQALEVDIVTPAENDVVLAGTTLQVLGTSTAASGTAPVDTVMFDGGQGFKPVDGKTNWQTLWPAPRFEADTQVVLRARAWAGDDSVTTVRHVTVTQPLVHITTPTENSDVTGDTDIDVTGTATGPTGGAAIDSVVVNIDGVLTTAEGTDTWSLVWRPDAVIADTPAMIIATAFAGFHTAVDTTTVTVIPAASP